VCRYVPETANEPVPSTSAVKVIEILRQTVRGLTPPALYRVGAQLLDETCIVRNMGLTGFLKFRRLLRNTETSSNEPLPIRVGGITHPIYVRPGTTDAAQILHSCIREIYGQFLPPDPVRLIIDAGANIGDSTVWYLSRFPEATVIAIEPDPDNFRMLEKNCRPYGDRAVPIQAALWPNDGDVLRMVDSTMAISKSVSKTPGDTGFDCRCVSLRSLLKLSSSGQVDIFKCDIEGSELELFSDGSDEWLPLVRNIAIELHTPECRQAVFSVTSRLGFSSLRYRELYIFARANDRSW
jgi:FkbM family methyltransferase